MKALRRAAASVAATAAVLIAGASAVAGEVVDLSSDAARPWFRADHFGVYVEDHRVGWMRRALVRTEHGGVDAVAREVEVHLDVAGDGNGISTTTRTVFLAGGAQELVHARTESAQQTRVAAWREVTRRDGRFDVVTSARGERTEGAVEAIDVTLADDLAFERIARLATERKEGAVGATLESAAFDVARMTATRRVLDVVAAEDTAAGRELEVRVRVGALVETARVDPAGGVISGSLGGRFRYRREPAEVAREPALRTSLEALSRVPLDGGLGDVRGIRRLALAWDGGTVRAFAPTGRQKVSEKDGVVAIEVSRDGPATPASDRAIEEALAAEPGLDVTDPQIGRGVSELLRGTVDRGPQVARILEFTSKSLEKSVVLGTPSALEILQSRRGDCTEHVRLFVALCRASGIPCRPVSGLSWMGDERGAFGWHQWAEVEIGRRWIVVDPTTGANPAPASLVALVDSQEVRARLWGARFRLVEVERDPPPQGGK